MAEEKEVQNYNWDDVQSEVEEAVLETKKIFIDRIDKLIDLAGSIMEISGSYFKGYKKALLMIKSEYLKKEKK